MLTSVSTLILLGCVCCLVLFQLDPDLYGDCKGKFFQDIYVVSASAKEGEVKGTKFMRLNVSRYAFVDLKPL